MEAPTPGGVGAFSMLFTLFHFINVQILLLPQHSIYQVLKELSLVKGGSMSKNLYW